LALTAAIGSGHAPEPVAADPILTEGADMSLTLSTMVAAAMLLIGAPADGARFVPEATDAGWDGAVATVAFREVGVDLETDATTISVTVTVDVDAVCRRGGSTVSLRRSATALDVRDYPIGEDGAVEGVAGIPLEVTGLTITGFTCRIMQVSVTAVLEDFWTGATLIDKP
jgi:hypothetical protein